MSRRRRKITTTQGMTYGGLPNQKKIAIPNAYDQGTVNNDTAVGGLPGQKPTPLASASPLLPPAGPPVDPQLEAQKAAAAFSTRTGDAWDTYKSGQIDLEYGNLDDPTADLASNPYSRAALLQKAYNDQKRGSLNSYASSGQLYAGSYQNKTEADRFGYDQGLDALKKGKTNATDSLLLGKLQRYGQTGATVDEGTLNSILSYLGVV